MRLESFFAESAFIKNLPLQMFLIELELVLELDQDRALSLRAMQHVPLKASI